MSGNNAEKVMLDWDRNNIEGAKLLKLGFEHLRIGLDNIEEAVVLVSYNHSYIDLFKKLTGKNIYSNRPHLPYIVKSHVITIVHASSKFLKPYSENNWITLLYLLRSLRKAKFVFQFSHADTEQNGIFAIKQTFLQFIELFHDKLPPYFFSCVGLLIVDASIYNKNNYLHRIVGTTHRNQVSGGIRDAFFLTHPKTEDVLKLANSIYKDYRIVLNIETLYKTSSLEELNHNFLAMLHKMNFIDMERWSTRKYLKIKYRLEGTKFPKITDAWNSLFEYILYNAHLLFPNGLSPSSYSSTITKYVYTLTGYVSSVPYPIVKNYETDASIMLMDNHARFFRRLFEFTSEELDRGGANSFEKNEKCIKEFFAILKDCNMLVDYVVERFFVAHFQFLKLFRLDENLEDYLESYDYILKIKGFENIEHLFDHSFNTLITLENRHFEDTQRNSPCFERIVYNLEAIKRKLAGLTEYQQEHKDWLSSRHEIKLNTMIVGLNFLSLKYDQDDNQRLRYLRKFIEHMKSPEKDTIKRMKTLPFEAETIVGDMLYKMGRNDLAVRIYLNNPDFTLNGFSSASYKIRRIYEHIYKLRPERIAFMNELEIIDLIGSDHFKMYTNYLANYKLHEQARKICYALANRAKEVVRVRGYEYKVVAQLKRINRTLTESQIRYQIDEKYHSLVLVEISLSVLENMVK